MSNKIQTFPFEKSIASLIEKSGSVAIASKLGEDDNKVIANIMTSEWEKEWVTDSLNKDVMFVPAILVSTNWNRNDDVFSPAETYRALHSPRYKPANMEHQGSEETDNQIIGVIQSSEAVDKELKTIYPSYEDNREVVPDFFHIAIGILIWEKYFPTRAEEIKEKSGKGEMYVSMEALFPDFGYALKAVDDPEGNIDLLPRIAATSWLSAHLKAFKGTGEVEIDGVKYRIGRWLRDITFSGVGFVEQPGNLSSVIFTDHIISKKDEEKSVASMSIVENNKKFSKNIQNGVSLNSVKHHPFDR